MCSFFLNLLFFPLNKFLVFRLPLYRYYAIPNVLCVYHLFNGGAKRVRTADLRLARAALSQLSYNPILFPAFLFLNSTLWWAQLESNQRPHPYQGCALTTAEL